MTIKQVQPSPATQEIESVAREPQAIERESAELVQKLLDRAKDLDRLRHLLGTIDANMPICTTPKELIFSQGRPARDLETWTPFMTPDGSWWQIVGPTANGQRLVVLAVAKPTPESGTEYRFEK